ncbi:NAD kinase [Moraxella caviae]|uniref:NAD kinase n=1 Tax=Moraxella caviae TaxID=34060 RepID=A0A1S9ZX67_9GAMM|nr:NAD(+) kinase [Moraxella caviae]OOR88055.1 NAD kinase [Moraxella caviae]STZ10009.1 Probable inorganic polyphosphate/ATP-NAD kinase [Moraxella caviae]VEW11330.1 Probable inorganic polyphosphate/ATP-NAD kinase [Moraxella caviae]VEW12940.1 Probable inorganic polyphosphate/ATP-NAD kinase [Moraxella caviae]
MSNFINNHPKREKFQRIGLMGRAGKSSVTDTLNQLIALLMARGLSVVIDTETAAIDGILIDFDEVDGNQLKIVPRHRIGEHCDFAVVVGGDGSMLQAASVLAGTNVPVLGINRGRLGFLADVNPDELEEKISQVLDGDYWLAERFLVKFQIVQNDEQGNLTDQVLHEDVALNDVVLHAGKSVHTIDFTLRINDMDVYRLHADGLIIATPTGSTAYSLSAGGPIIHPTIDAISLVPMHPHTLSSRPLVVAGSSRIAINVHKDNRTQPMVGADGKASAPLDNDHTLIVTKHDKTLLLLHPPSFNFYKACRTKLHWSAFSEEFALEGDKDK